MIRENIANDFQRRVRFHIGKHRMLPPNVDFDLIFTTENTKQPYKATKRGDVYTNCHVDGDELIVDFDNHHLGLGQITATLLLFIPDKNCKDGTLRRTTSTLVDTQIVAGRGTDFYKNDIIFDVQLGYCLFDAYTIAKEHGFEGTAQEYYATFSLINKTLQEIQQKFKDYGLDGIKEAIVRLNERIDSLNLIGAEQWIGEVQHSVEQIEQRLTDQLSSLAARLGKVDMSNGVKLSHVEIKRLDTTPSPTDYLGTDYMLVQSKGMEYWEYRLQKPNYIIGNRIYYNSREESIFNVGDWVNLVECKDEEVVYSRDSSIYKHTEDVHGPFKVERTFVNDHDEYVLVLNGYLTSTAKPSIVIEALMEERNGKLYEAKPRLVGIVKDIASKTLSKPFITDIYTAQVEVEQGCVPDVIKDELKGVHFV